MWDEIIYLFLNFNGATVEVDGMDNKFHTTLYRGVWLLFHAGMLVKGAPDICSNLVKGLACLQRIPPANLFQLFNILKMDI